MDSDCNCGNWECILVAGTRCMLCPHPDLGWEELSTAIMHCLAKYLTWLRKGPEGSGAHCRAIPVLRAAISNTNYRKKERRHTASRRQPIIPLLEPQCNLCDPSMLNNIPGVNQCFKGCFSREAISSVLLKQ